jgi:hypothetical protein
MEAMEMTYQASLDTKALGFVRLKAVEDLVYWLNYAAQTPEAHVKDWALMKAQTTRLILRETLKEARSLK